MSQKSTIHPTLGKNLVKYYITKSKYLIKNTDPTNPGGSNSQNVDKPQIFCVDYENFPCSGQSVEAGKYGGIVLKF